MGRMLKSIYKVPVTKDCLSHCKSLSCSNNHTLYEHSYFALFAFPINTLCDRSYKPEASEVSFLFLLLPFSKICFL